jgi:signal transduction histidine kinase
MLDLRRSAISKKLTLMNVLVSVAALLSACLAFFAYDQFTFREELIRNLSAQAEIIGSNSVSALTFNDPQAANNTLAALRTVPDIISAGIISADGQLFAHYAKDPSTVGVDPFPAILHKQTYTFTDDQVLLSHPIVFQGAQLGTVYIRSDLNERAVRLKRYVTIAAAILLLSLLAALLVSSIFRRAVAEPIVELAAVARTVSLERDYSVRARPTGTRDEVAVLIDAFNDMLSQIQRRDNELQEAHAELERRVEERTRQLVAANRELEAFSYSVSHDLRGPLEVINGFSHILLVEQGLRIDPSARDYVQQIGLATQRMAELIDDLLNLSRVSTVGMHRERVDLAVIARSVADQLCRREPARKVEFILHQCPVIDGDSRLLRIVLENLLRNAWKYTSNRELARIEFGCEERLGHPAFYLRDNGAGFDPALADRLFKPFQRLHATSEFPGTGIGLATVQRIVTRHGGELWAEGVINQGATFYFTIGAGS